MFSASALLGGVLGGVTSAAARLRPAAKPLHPTGRVRRATMTRYGAATGVEFLDTARTDEVLVRESRAAGLPAPLPDVHGLAIRVPGEGDVLLNTAGFGRWSRYALVPTRSTYARPLSTLIPYETPLGPVLIGARRVAADRLVLTYAVAGAPFRPFGELALGAPEADQEISFDPVANTPPGLAQYDAVRRLRAPSYAAARAARGETGPSTAVGPAV
jgi:hypothetical protein